MGKVIVVDILDSTKNAKRSKQSYDDMNLSGKITIAPAVVVSQNSRSTHIVMSMVWSILYSLGIPIDFSIINTFNGFSYQLVSGIIIHMGLHGNKTNYIIKSNTYRSITYLNKKMLVKAIYCTLNRLFPTTDICIIDTACNRSCKDCEFENEITSRKIIDVISQQSQESYIQMIEDHYYEFKARVGEVPVSLFSNMIMANNQEPLTAAFLRYSANFIDPSKLISDALLPDETDIRIHMGMRFKTSLYACIAWDPFVRVEHANGISYDDVIIHEAIAVDLFNKEFSIFKKHLVKEFSALESMSKNCYCCHGWQLRDNNIYISYSDDDGFGHFFSDKEGETLYSMAHCYVSNLSLLMKHNHVAFFFNQATIFNITYLMSKYEETVFGLTSTKQSLYCYSKLSYNDLLLTAKQFYIFHHDTYVVPEYIKLHDIVSDTVISKLVDNQTWFVGLQRSRFLAADTRIKYTVQSTSSGVPDALVSTLGHVIMVAK